MRTPSATGAPSRTDDEARPRPKSKQDLPTYWLSVPVFRRYIYIFIRLFENNLHVLIVLVSDSLLLCGPSHHAFRCSIAVLFRLQVALDKNQQDPRGFHQATGVRICLKPRHLISPARVESYFCFSLSMGKVMFKIFQKYSEFSFEEQN